MARRSLVLRRLAVEDSFGRIPATIVDLPDGVRLVVAVRPPEGVAPENLPPLASWLDELAGPGRVAVLLPHGWTLEAHEIEGGSA